MNRLGKAVSGRRGGTFAGAELGEGMGHQSTQQKAVLSKVQ